MKKELNNKGFTLIELLAVIVILAILMGLAVTSVQKIIDNAKKDTYITTAQSFVNAVRIGVVNMDYATPEGGSCVIVPVSLIELEQGNQTSPFGKKYVDANSFVLIRNDSSTGSNKLLYYVTMVDESKNGFKLTQDTVLDRKYVLVRGEGSFSGVARPTGSGGVAAGNTALNTAISCSSVKTCSATGCS